MGLLDLYRQRRAAENSRAWQPDGTGVDSNGDCGGDIQQGDSYSVRFLNPHIPGAIVTVTFYAAEYDDAPGEFIVQRQVEWLLCEDPAEPWDTEIWSDADYDDMGDMYDAADDAERAAREHAGRSLEDAPGEIDWAGETW